MADALGPGDVVVCTRYFQPPGWYGWICIPITVGSIYKVRDIDTESTPGDGCPWDSCGLTGLRIEGSISKYCPNLFRKPGEHFTQRANEVGDKVEDAGFAEPKVIKPVIVPEKVDA